MIVFECEFANARGVTQTAAVCGLAVTVVWGVASGRPKMMSFLVARDYPILVVNRPERRNNAFNSTIASGVGSRALTLLFKFHSDTTDQGYVCAGFAAGSDDTDALPS